MSAEDRARMLSVQQLLLDRHDIADVAVFERAKRPSIWDSIRFDLTFADGFACEAILISNHEEALSGTVYIDLFKQDGQHLSTDQFFDVSQPTNWAEHIATTVYNAAKLLRVKYDVRSHPPIGRNI